MFQTVIRFFRHTKQKSRENAVWDCRITIIIEDIKVVKWFTNMIFIISFLDAECMFNRS